MKQGMRRVLFIQGAGAGAYDADKLLADSLQNELGERYEVRYPEMPDENNAPYDRWRPCIEAEIRAIQGPVILVGHSIGASHLIKCLSETSVKTSVVGVFLLAAPFWGGEGWHYEGYEELQLPQDIANALPKRASMFLYHSRDDGTVPFAHLALYARLLPDATVRVIDTGGHQLNNDASPVAVDIEALAGVQ